MLISTSQLIAVDRQWHRVVFGRTLRNAFLIWLGVSVVLMLIGAMAGWHGLTIASVGYTFPLLFLCTAWLWASACALRAAAALCRRELIVAVWMLGWTALLAVVGWGIGVRWLLHGLTSDVRQ